MRVIDKRGHHPTKEFKDLSCGVTFLNKRGELCMKIAQLWDGDESVYNTVILKNGIVSCNGDHDDVIVVESTVTFTDAT